MTHSKVSELQIVAAYALATLLYGVAIYLGSLDPVFGPKLMRGLGIVSLLLVGAATFEWGKREGYPVFSEERGFSLEFLARNLVMTVLVIVMLSLFASALWLGVYSLLKRAG